jgi:ribosomal protein S12 methylthiotransferase accessory factor
VDAPWIPSHRRVPVSVTPTSVLDASRGLVHSYANNPPYYDEPKLFSIAALLSLPEDVRIHADQIAPDLALGFAGGASLDKERALWKVAGEAVERYALLNTGAKPVCSDFKSLGAGSALDPNTIAAGTSRTPTDRRACVIDWLQGFDAKQGRQKWIPYQLVAVPHLYADREIVWRAPISTGAAAAFSVEEALYEGLCEVIERDAFMVSWLRQIHLVQFHIIDCDTTDAIQALLSRTVASVVRYRLTPNFFVLPTGLPVFTIMCVLWDNTGLGPAATIGTKASWSLPLAVLGALEEALQERPWVRSIYERISDSDKNKAVGTIYTMTERATLWLSREAISVLRNWLNQSNSSITMGSLAAESEPCSLQDLALAIERQQATAFGVDLTQYLPEGIKELGLHVVKAIVPEYQPLYLIEELNDYAWPRLLSVEQRLGVKARQSKEIPFSFPHPFL